MGLGGASFKVSGNRTFTIWDEERLRDAIQIHLNKKTGAVSPDALNEYPYLARQAKYFAGEYLGGQAVSRTLEYFGYDIIRQFEPRDTLGVRQTLEQYIDEDTILSKAITVLDGAVGKKSSLRKLIPDDNDYWRVRAFSKAIGRQDDALKLIFPELQDKLDSLLYSKYAHFASWSISDVLNEHINFSEEFIEDKVYSWWKQMKPLQFRLLPEQGSEGLIIRRTLDRPKKSFAKNIRKILKKKIPEFHEQDLNYLGSREIGNLAEYETAILCEAHKQKLLSVPELDFFGTLEKVIFKSEYMGVALDTNKFADMRLQFKELHETGKGDVLVEVKRLSSIDESTAKFYANKYAANSSFRDETPIAKEFFISVADCNNHHHLVNALNARGNIPLLSPNSFKRHYDALLGVLEYDDLVHLPLFGTREERKEKLQLIHDQITRPYSPYGRYALQTFTSWSMGVLEKVYSALKEGLDINEPAVKLNKSMQIRSHSHQEDKFTYVGLIHPVQKFNSHHIVGIGIQNDSGLQTFVTRDPSEEKQLLNWAHSQLNGSALTYAHNGGSVLQRRMSLYDLPASRKIKGAIKRGITHDAAYIELFGKTALLDKKVQSEFATSIANASSFAEEDFSIRSPAELYNITHEYLANQVRLIQSLYRNTHPLIKDRTLFS
jgi:hypothetical protein